MSERQRIDPVAAAAATRLPASLAAELLEESLHAVPTSDLRDIGARLLAPLVRATGARRASLMLVNPETGKLRIVAGLGLNAELIDCDMDWRPNSIAEWVFRKRQGLVLNGPILRDGLVGTSEGVIDSAICVPLENEDYMLGVLNVASIGTGPPFTEADMMALRAMLPPVSAAIERAQHANLCKRNTEQLLAVTGLKDRTLLAPGRYEGLNYELGFARLSSVNNGGTVCERVPLANGGQVLLALDPREAGVNGLLTAAFAQGVFAAIATTERSASAVATRLNAELCARLLGRGEMGAWIAQLSPRGQLTSCTAGYAPPLWVPADDSPATHLGSGGPMVGSEARAHWEEEQVRLLPGDMVITVSSGVLGARNVMGQPFGPERLRECIAERRRQELDTLAGGIISAVIAWTGRPVPTDDLCVLAVRFTPGG